LWFEIAVFFPKWVPFAFDRGWVVMLVHACQFSIM
jgi:hypothetical protein